MTRPSDGAHPNGSARRILSNAGYRSAADICGKVASLILYLAMARKLGASDFGAFTFAFSLVGVVVVLATFGQDWVLVREVAADHERVDVYFANTVAVTLAVALPVLTVTVAALVPFASAKTVEVTALVAAALLIEKLTMTCSAVCQAYEKMALPALVYIPKRFFTAGVGIVALLLGAGVVVVSAVYLLFAALALVLTTQLMFARVVRPKLEITTRAWLPLMKAAVPLGISAFASIVLFRIDVVILAAFKPSSVVGEYGVAYRLFESTLFVTWAVCGAVFPVFSRLTSSTEPRVGLVFERAMKLLAAVTLPLAVGAGLLAGPVIHTLYGRQYDSAPTALRLLAPAVALYPLSLLAGYLLVSQRRQLVLTVTYAAVAIENILLNLVLIPTLSLNGAALGTSISELLVAAALMGYAQRTVGGIGWYRILAGPALSSACAGAAMVALAGNFAVAVLAGAAVYLVSLAAFEKVAFPEDARVIIRLARRDG